MSALYGDVDYDLAEVCPACQGVDGEHEEDCEEGEAFDFETNGRCW